MSNEIKDFAADAAINEPAPEAPAAPVPETAEQSKKRRTRSTFTRPEVVEAVAPALTPIDERTRLEMAAGAAMLKQHEERLKKAE